MSTPVTNESIRAWLTAKIAEKMAEIRAWTKAINADPGKAASCDELLHFSAEVALFTDLHRAMRPGSKATPETFRAHALDNVMRMAPYNEHSSSITGNLSRRYTLAAWATLLDPLSGPLAS